MGPTFAALLVLAAPAAQDTDGDGLTDFLEVHKYLTDPAQADSDGDGLPDGNWQERREFTYTVRSILQVAPPVTDDVLQDDFQDARILDRGAEYVELEVIHYPFSSAQEQIRGRGGWRDQLVGMDPWLQSGPTSNFDAGMTATILDGLRGQGIDVAAATDTLLASNAARWLLDHAKSRDGFSTYCSAWIDGEVRVYPGLEASAQRGIEASGLSLAEQWKRELFAADMFRSKSRGSCTSSAIYLNGGLRSIGIPTRIVLCVPLIDASDPRELPLLERIRHPLVRRVLGEAIPGRSRAWTSHTFNEVFVGGRWQRLNYTRLGQPILDPHYLGLMTHVATVSDWLDGEFASTWGTRQAERPADDAFGFANPYSTLTLSDQLGEHADAEALGWVEAGAQLAAGEGPAEALSQAPVSGPAPVRVRALTWAFLSNSEESPFGPEDRQCLYVQSGLAAEFPELKAFTAEADRTFYLVSPGQTSIALGSGIGGRSATAGGGELDGSFLMLRPTEGSWDQLQPGARYLLVPRNASPSHLWHAQEALQVVP